MLCFVFPGKASTTEPDTGGIESSDAHGGNDPEQVAAPGSPRLGMLGVTKGEQKDGSLQEYLKQPNVELTSLSLKSEQVLLRLEYCLYGVMPQAHS